MMADDAAGSGGENDEHNAADEDIASAPQDETGMCTHIANFL